MSVVSCAWQQGLVAVEDLRAFHVLAFLGIVASASLVIGLVVLTRHMDRAQRTQEVRLVSALVDSDLAAARTSAVSLAKSDDAIRHLDHGRDVAWATERFRNTANDQVWIYTFDYLDRVVSGLHAAHGGARGDFGFENGLSDQVARLRRTSFKPALSANSPAVAMLGFWSGEALYLLVAAPFSPASSDVAIVHPEPPVLLAVTPMRAFLHDELAAAGILDLRLRQGSQAAAGASKALTDDQGRTVATLSWRPAQPGANLLRNVAAPLTALVGAFLALLAYAYRRGIRSSQALVASEARASHLALHDQLTEIPNRRFFMEELRRAVAGDSRGQTEFAVLMIDLDRFKAVNDTYGHQCGDELIWETARRLALVCRTRDFCARLGGDEFVILAYECGRADAAVLAGRVLDALSQPVRLSTSILTPAASIGVSVFRSQMREEIILREADFALYRAKANGRGSFCFFETDRVSNATKFSSFHLHDQT